MSPDWRKMGLVSQADPLPSKHSPLPSVDPMSWRRTEIRGFEPQTGTPDRQVFVEITGQSHLQWDRLTLSPLWSRGTGSHEVTPRGSRAYPMAWAQAHAPAHIWSAGVCTQSRPHRYTQGQCRNPECFLSLYRLRNQIL